LKGEGVAYRGRLMVEIETIPGEEIKKEIDSLSPQDVVRAQVHFLHTRARVRRI